MRSLTARGPFDFSYSLLGYTFEPEDNLFIPLRRMCEAILLGVHLRFSYSLLGSTFESEDILFIFMVGGGGGPLFGSLNLTKIGQQVVYR